MSKTIMITARVDPKLKRATEKVLKELGLTTSQAITLYFNQISLRKGLPFAIALPNTETAQAIEAALAGIDLYTADSVDALFDDLGPNAFHPLSWAVQTGFQTHGAARPRYEKIAGRDRKTGQRSGTGSAV